MSCAYRISQAENLQKVAHENDRWLTSEMNDVNMIMCMNYDVSKRPHQGLHIKKRMMMHVLWIYKPMSIELGIVYFGWFWRSQILHLNFFIQLTLSIWIWIIKELLTKLQSALPFTNIKSAIFIFTKSTADTESRTKNISSLTGLMQLN